MLPCSHSIASSPSIGGFSDARFNQDRSCLAVSCAAGFRIYNCNPFSLACERDLSAHVGGGVRTVEMMYRCNIVAAVGDDSAAWNSSQTSRASAEWTRNVLLLWDDKECCEIARLMFNSSITNVKLSRHLLVVAVVDEVHVYHLHDMNLLDTYSTFYNPEGLCSLASNCDVDTVAFPSPTRGMIGMAYYHLDCSDGALLGREGKTILAHNSDITALGLSVDGLLLMSASRHGHFVRLWNAFSVQLLQEFRKVPGMGLIHLCVLSPDATILCTVSNRNAVLVYRVNPQSPRVRRDGRDESFASARRVSSAPTNGLDNFRLCLHIKLMRVRRLYTFYAWPFSRYYPEDMVVACTFLPTTNNLLLVLSNGHVHRLGVNYRLRLLADHSL
ncbi:hypothetical protein, conserved [Babesia bigemina]|uniref:Uncharacterized protein n=1 Tax=Babesia bigemina TaxID=5866 RepID=A0A061D2K2_BABBI|nr:hypothetical protein, conserved [Babesia bigemina]CDR94818.1 hypothetical protein, conserved [Babesia bigemina]|eukprot:XP_012767004.1 hypothetical protein, conserved [Babesia bigemina]